MDFKKKSIIKTTKILINNNLIALTFLHKKLAQ